jgi:PII-like signaling protein
VFGGDRLVDRRELAAVFAGGCLGAVARVGGATVLLGVDGTSHGIRRRASLIGRNADVPLMLIAIGGSGPIAAAADTLAGILPDPLMTIENVQVCKRDGQMLESPRPVPDTGESGLAVWRKLTVHAGEQARHDGAPLYPQLVRGLRGAGALGATVLRGIWGYHGNHEPHGDRLLAVRRRVPVVTVVVDTPERSRKWFELIDALTDQTGLVASELVPAVRASGPDVERGGLRLAHPPR